MLPPGEHAFDEQLKRERAACERSDELADVRRERDKIRQRNSCLCRKYRLKGNRKRRKRNGGGARVRPGWHRPCTSMMETTRRRLAMPPHKKECPAEK